MDDRGLYAPGQQWLQRDDILGTIFFCATGAFLVYVFVVLCSGRARGVLRFLGMVTIILNDFPIVKYVLIGIYCYILMILLTHSFRSHGIIRSDK